MQHLGPSQKPTGLRHLCACLPLLLSPGPPIFRCTKVLFRVCQGSMPFLSHHSFLHTDAHTHTHAHQSGSFLHTHTHTCTQAPTHISQADQPGSFLHTHTHTHTHTRTRTHMHAHTSVRLPPAHMSALSSGIPLTVASMPWSLLGLPEPPLGSAQGGVSCLSCPQYQGRAGPL